LAGIVVTRGQVVLASTHYGYDKKDNVVCKSFSSYDLQPYTETFRYDAMDRLTRADGEGLYGSKTYFDDCLDNIVLKDGCACRYVSGKAHTLASDGRYSYGYDANGNMVSRSDGRVISYDADNRIVAISGGSSYAYDASGQRVLKVEGGTRTFYFFPQYEEQQAGFFQRTTTKYYYANGARVAQRMTPKGLLYYHVDHLGSGTSTLPSNRTRVRGCTTTGRGTTMRNWGAF
jgi:hypothetical protein